MDSLNGRGVLPRWLCVGLVIVLPAMTGKARAESSEWPTAHGSADFRSRADGPTDGTWRALWNVGVKAPIDVAPVADGERVYVFTRRGKVVALSLKDGAEVWAYSLPPPPGKEGDPPSLGAAIDGTGVLVGGRLVVASHRGQVVALDARNGTPLWNARVKGPVVASLNRVTLANDRLAVLVVSSTDGIVHRLDAATGEPVWETEPMERIDSPPAVSGDQVVIGGCTSSMAVIDAADGKQLNTVAVGEGCEIASGAAVADGKAYVGNRAGELVCADLEYGTVDWRDAADDAGEAFRVPAVGDRRVVYAFQGGALRCLERKDGTLLWQKEVDGDPSSPILFGTVVCYTLEGRLHVVRLNDGEELWRRDVADTCPAPIAAGGRIIACGDDGTVLAAGVIAAP